MPFEEYDYEAEAFVRAGEFANLEVPISDQNPTQEFADKWVIPFYRTNLVLNYETFKSNFSKISDEIDDQLITELLSQRNWRPRITAAYFVAIKNMSCHCDHIGKLLLRSDVCFAGRGYALALARINTPQSHEFLFQYSEHYLKRPDLEFDQSDVLGAIDHCDRLNGTRNIDSFESAWVEYSSSWTTPRSLPKAIEWFQKKMESIIKLSGFFG